MCIINITVKIKIVEGYIVIVTVTGLETLSPGSLQVNILWYFLVVW